MSLLDNIVNINIQATANAPTQANFGTPLILPYHTHWTDKVRTYFDIAGMLSDGFTAHEPAVLMATAILSQNPHPPTFKVGRLSTAPTQVFTFLVTDNTNGDSVGFTLTDPSGNVTDCHHTPSSETTAQVATAIGALVPAGVNAVVVGSTITCTVAVAGNHWFVKAVSGGTFTSTTASVTPDADLTNILLVDDQFYTVTCSLQSAANISAMASWAEANNKLHCYSTLDTAVLNTPSSNIFKTLQTAGYKRSYGQFGGDSSQYGGLALAAQRLTADPGSDTWAYKNLAGVNADSLTPTQETNITNDNGNYYTTIAGINATIDGRSAQGQFIDFQRGLDALSDDMQKNVFGVMTSVPKVPYTIHGIEMIASVMRASLSRFVRSGFLSNDPGFQPLVFPPTLPEISPLDKKNRILRSMNFTATAQGAVHKIIINGTLSF